MRLIRVKPKLDQIFKAGDLVRIVSVNGRAKYNYFNNASTKSMITSLNNGIQSSGKVIRMNHGRFADAICVNTAKWGQCWFAPSDLELA